MYTNTMKDRERERERDLANCFCFLQDSSNLQIGFRTMNAGSRWHCRLQVEGLTRKNFSLSSYNCIRGKKDEREGCDTKYIHKPPAKSYLCSYLF